MLWTVAQALEGERQSVKIDRAYFGDLVRNAVQKRAPQIFVMTRESTEALLKVNAKAIADCAGGCESEIGKKLSADLIVLGQITQIGTRLVLTMRLFSAAEGKLVDSEEARGKTQDELLDEADKAVAHLVEALAQGPAVAATPAAADKAPVAVAAEKAPLAEKKEGLQAGGIESKSGLAFVSIPAGNVAIHQAIAGGAFMGIRTSHDSYVGAFRFGVTPVTQTAYKRCVDAGACTQPGTEADCNWGSDRSDQPINCVDWKQATSFCEWVGGRLPGDRAFKVQFESDKRSSVNLVKLGLHRCSLAEPCPGVLRTVHAMGQGPSGSASACARLSGIEAIVSSFTPVGTTGQEGGERARSRQDSRVPIHGPLGQYASHRQVVS